ncbi:MAG: hypothetical protein ACYCZK_02555 [Microbacteriaceae bacterium]
MAITKALNPSRTAGTGPRKCTRKSLVDSPIAVDSALMAQKYTVTWGTLSQP